MYQNSLKNPQSKTIRSANAIKKQKFKILVLIATVSITFALTWLPAHVIQIWKVAFNSYFPYSDSMYIIKVISHTLTYSNSLLNPIIYVFIGAKFRSHIYSEINEFYQFYCLNNKNHSSAKKFSNCSSKGENNFQKNQDFIMTRMNKNKITSTGPDRIYL